MRTLVYLGNGPRVTAVRRRSWLQSASTSNAQNVSLHLPESPCISLEIGRVECRPALRRCARLVAVLETFCDEPARNRRSEQLLIG